MSAIPTAGQLGGARRPAMAIIAAIEDVLCGGCAAYLPTRFRETLGRATEWRLLGAGDPEAGRQARHRGSGAEVTRWEYARGWLSGRVVGPFGHQGDRQAFAARRGME